MTNQIEQTTREAAERIIALCKNLDVFRKRFEAKIPKSDCGSYCLANYPKCSPDSDDPDIRDYCAASALLKEFLKTLSFKMLNDIMALMYLGRNGAWDGVQYMPTRERFPFYRKEHRSKDNKDITIKRIAGKSPLLHEYLEEGLRWLERRRER